MFVLAVEEDVEALARLIRLMLNIEHGVRLYEWGPGSAEAPHAAPAPGFLTLELPGAVDGPPPLCAEYRPTVGIIFYLNSPSFDPGALARELKKRLLREDDGHLAGPHTTEVSPHASVLHEGRTYPGVDLTGPRPPFERGWYPGTTYPTRHLHYVSPQGDCVLPAHNSLRGSFSWYLLPAAALARVRQVSNMAEFNALVASILFDTGRRPSSEPAEPIYERPEEHLRVPLLPPPVVRALAEAPQDWAGVAPPPPPGEARRAPGQGVILLHVGDHFEVAGLVLRDCLAGWAPPPAAPEEGPLSALNLVEADRCTFCWLPLWGEFYAASFPGLSPYRAPVCRWCYGCYPHAHPAPVGGESPHDWGTVRATHPRGVLEAFGRPEYGYLRPVLGVPARRVPLAARGGQPVYVVEGEEGGWILDPLGGSTQPADPFLCLSAPELADWRLPTAAFERIAEHLRTPAG